MRFSNIEGGFLPLFAGAFCRHPGAGPHRRRHPRGGNVDIVDGGRLVGEYSLGDFWHCGLNTPLINQPIPGGGNTNELEPSNPRLAD